MDVEASGSTLDKVKRLTEREGSWSLLDIHRDVVVAAYSSIAVPHQLVNPLSYCLVNYNVQGH